MVMQIFYVKLMNSLFYLLLLWQPLTGALADKRYVFYWIFVLFSGRCIESMRTGPNYPSMFFSPMPPKSSSHFGMILDEGGGAPWSQCCCWQRGGTRYGRVVLTILYSLDKKNLKRKNYFVCSRTIQRSLLRFGWCEAYIFSRMKMVRKDICFAPSKSEFVNGIYKKSHIGIHTPNFVILDTKYYI